MKNEIMKIIIIIMWNNENNNENENDNEMKIIMKILIMK